MTYPISLGPFYPGWPGTLRVDLTVQDGIVQTATAVPLHARPPRPEDWAGLSPEEALAGVERLCAASTYAHTLAYCQTLEKIGGGEPPPRARYLRTILVELERLGSHLGSAANVLLLASLPHPAGDLLELAEEVRRAHYQLTGKRFFSGLIVPGGVQRDLVDLALLAPLIRRLKGQAYRLAHRVVASRARVAPLIGAGLLTREQAEEQGVGGPALRAAEADRDLRRDQPYAAYGDLDPLVVTQGGGDVFSRWMVLLLEAFESLRQLEAALAALPAGPVRAEMTPLPAGEDQSRVESPAGPLVVRVQVDAAGQLVGLWRTMSTPVHLAALPQTLLGQRLELVGVIVASWGLCSPCLLR
jgi:Ni,Fe-hydrogenase III large subunit